MKIPVVFADQKRGTVKAAELQKLIQDLAILSFYRSDGECVVLGSGAIRGMGGKKYRGPERRGNVLFF